MSDTDTILEQATSEADPDGTCARCHEFMATEPGLDPTPLCNCCAQEVLPLLAAELILLRAQMRRGRG